MRKIEVEVFSEAVNAPVIRMPTRRFPGVVIQGDTLQGLWGLARCVLEKFGDVDDEGDVELLESRLRSFVRIYEETLAQEGMRLPY